MNRKLLKAKSSNQSESSSETSICVKCSKENKKNTHRLDPLLFPITYSNSKLITNFSLPRKYTSIHNDETKEIFLSIGPDYNQRMLDTEEAKVVQSQVIGKWVMKDHKYYIKLKVIVSSEQNPQAQIRNQIFCNEMAPVLEGIALAETCLIKSNKCFRDAEILIHFQSIDSRYNRTEYWKTLEYWSR